MLDFPHFDFFLFVIIVREFDGAFSAHGITPAKRPNGSGGIVSSLRR
jgi:hypothetical protein